MRRLRREGDKLLKRGVKAMGSGKPKQRASLAPAEAAAGGARWRNALGKVAVRRSTVEKNRSIKRGGKTGAAL